MSLTTIGVVGAGQMGSGIAHVLALGGYQVLISDAKPDVLQAALSRIEHNLERQVARSVISPEQRLEAIGRISTVDDFAALGEADLVIEAVPEVEDLKTAVFRQLAPVLRPDAILASNTSSLSITRLSAASGRADRFVGLHFMNPVPRMPLVEIIRGLATTDATARTAGDMVAKIGKTAAVVQDYPAFAVNRILLPMINEAIFAVFEGVASVETIDVAMRLGSNHPLGPLQLADLIGLDTCLAILKVMQQEFGDPKYRPCPLLARYVEAGWLGRKSGRGFYVYPADKA